MQTTTVANNLGDPQAGRIRIAGKSRVNMLVNMYYSSDLITDRLAQAAAWHYFNPSDSLTVKGAAPLPSPSLATMSTVARVTRLVSEQCPPAPTTALNCLRHVSRKTVPPLGFPAHQQQAGKRMPVPLSEGTVTTAAPVGPICGAADESAADGVNVDSIETGSRTQLRGHRSVSNGRQPTSRHLTQ
jgi:hypothetical protein